MTMLLGHRWTRQRPPISNDCRTHAIRNRHLKLVPRGSDLLQAPDHGTHHSSTSSHVTLLHGTSAFRNLCTNMADSWCRLATQLYQHEQAAGGTGKERDPTTIKPPPQCLFIVLFSLIIDTMNRMVSMHRPRNTSSIQIMVSSASPVRLINSQLVLTSPIPLQFS